MVPATWLCVLIFVQSPPEIDGPERAARLRAMIDVAGEMFESISSNNPELFLRRIHPKYELNVNADIYLKPDELKRLFEEGEGEFYCRLYETECISDYLAGNKKSFHEIFLNEKDIRVTIEFQQTIRTDPETLRQTSQVNYKLGFIKYSWEGGPKKYGWISFPYFHLDYIDGRWWVAESSQVP